MRVTIDLSDDLRARVMALTARDGRTFSSVVSQALERYLASDDFERARRVSRALAALGGLPASSADAMRGRIRQIRRRWRG